MNFTVVWTKEAMDDLTEIWTQSSDRKAVTTASDRIDALLRRNPLGVGKSMVDDGRMLFEVPLAVTFRVSDVDRLVTVNFVCRF
jgi:plasmid stabilization system protein ParE